MEDNFYIDYPPDDQDYLDYYEEENKIEQEGEKMISRKIKVILQTKKWRQVRLAKHLGINPPRLCYWLHGMTEPKEEWIIQEINKLYEECINGKGVSHD